MEELAVKSSEKIYVSARMIHERLEIATRFATWFERMCDFGFSEGIDFFPKMGKITGAGRPSVDYDITVDMAKHICMLQRTEAGKKVRQYLIDLEKSWNSPELIMARALKVAASMIEDRDAKIAEMTPKAEYFDELVDKNLLTNFRDTAKELRIGERSFISFLLDKKYLYRDQKGRLKPYADKTDLFELKEFSSRHNGHADLQTLITPKGREKFRLLVKEVV